MGHATANVGQFVDTSRHFARQAFIAGENRLELLAVEMQEERTRLLRAILLALGVAAFGFLALLGLNIALVILFWNLSPITVLLVLSGVYLFGGFYFYRRLTLLLGDGQMLSATLDQLRKDRECLEKKLF